MPVIQGVRIVSRLLDESHHCDPHLIAHFTVVVRNLVALSPLCQTKKKKKGVSVPDENPAYEIRLMVD